VRERDSKAHDFVYEKKNVCYTLYIVIWEKLFVRCEKMLHLNQVFFIDTQGGLVNGN
jgi:hypothetical protein